MDKPQNTIALDFKPSKQTPGQFEELVPFETDAHGNPNAQEVRDYAVLLAKKWKCEIVNVYESAELYGQVDQHGIGTGNLK